MREPLSIFRVRYNMVIDKIEGLNRNKEVYCFIYAYTVARGMDEVEIAFKKFKKKRESMMRSQKFICLGYGLQQRYLIKDKDYENPRLELKEIEPVGVKDYKIRLEKLVSHN